MNIEKDKIESALGKIRPFLAADGGNVELVDVDEDGTVKVRLTGACGGCAMAEMTLRNAVEKTIKAEVPAVKAVVSV
ncbi:MAG: NifU family protein [Dehalococcoidia bacterium]|nr:NifU family protein [Dehalococcoidia bacterium]